MPTAFCWSPCCTAAPPRKVWHHLIALCRAHSNMSMSFLYWVARNWILYSICVSPVLSREEGSTSFNFWQHLLIQPRTQLAVSTTEANCWLISHLVSTRIYRSFSAPQQSASSTCSCMYGVILSQVQDSTFPSMEFLWFLSAHFSSLSQSSWRAAYPSGWSLLSIWYSSLSSWECTLSSTTRTGFIECWS